MNNINNIIYIPRPHQSPLTTRPLDQKKSQPTGSESDQLGPKSGSHDRLLWASLLNTVPGANRTYVY